MGERKDNSYPFKRESKAGGVRQMAWAIYATARYIQQKDFYGELQVSREEIEKGIAIAGRFIGRKSRDKLRESVSLLILCFLKDDLLITKRQAYRIGRCEKFSFKQDEDSRARFCEILAFFGERGGIDPGIVERHRAEARNHLTNIK